MNWLPAEGLQPITQSSSQLTPKEKDYAKDRYAHTRKAETAAEAMIFSCLLLSLWIK
jgi:hypothetical protein